MILAVFSCASAQAAPGALDTGFGTGGKVTTPILSGDNEGLALAIQPDGKLVVAGNVAIGQNDEAFALARYRPNGSLDPSFGSGGVVTTDFGSFRDVANAVLRQRDGKLVAVGHSRQNPGNIDVALARYNRDGSLDTSFGTGGKVVANLGSSSDVASTATLQPDGKIVTGGWVAPSGQPLVFALARFNPNGSLDTSFGTGGKVTTQIGSNYDDINEIVRQPDGKLVAVGRTQIVQGASWDFALARYNPDGSLDSTFGNGGKVTTSIAAVDDAYGIALQRNGKIVVAGDSGPTFADRDFALVRYNPNGSLDTSFGSGGKVVTSIGPGAAGIFRVAVQLNGKIVGAGDAPIAPPRDDVAVLRYRANGSLDPSFGKGGVVTTTIGRDSYTGGLGLQPDGKIVITGGADSGSNWDFALARYQGDTCTVPKLKGKPVGTAKRSIRRATCAVGKVEQRASRTVKKGRVIAQKPAAGKKVASATPVNLVVSRGR